MDQTAKPYSLSIPEGLGVPMHLPCQALGRTGLRETKTKSGVQTKRIICREGFIRTLSTEVQSIHPNLDELIPS